MNVDSKDKSIIFISNADNRLFPGNDQSDFICKFPRDLDAQSVEYEIALCKIKFNNYIYNLDENIDWKIRVIDVDSPTNITDITVKPGYYKNLNQLLLEINNLAKQTNTQFSCGFCDISGKTYIEKCNVNTKFLFSTKLGELLGFYTNNTDEKDREITVNKDEKHYSLVPGHVQPIDRIYVYLDILNNSHIVGNQLTNLLCVCPVNKSGFGDSNSYEPKHLAYLAVRRQRFLFCRFYITDCFGNKISFQRGTVEIAALLRPISQLL